MTCFNSKGVENLDSGVGIYAPDAQSYKTFAALFDPIIDDYHKGFKPTDKHPQTDFGNIEHFVNVDPKNEYVISTRVRCGRSLKGYPFNPMLTEAVSILLIQSLFHYSYSAFVLVQQYKEMETKVKGQLATFEGELKGTYYPLLGMDKATQQKLIDDHFLFKEGDRFLQAANACRYWPVGRGIFHNDKKTFLMWVNEEGTFYYNIMIIKRLIRFLFLSDHLRIISMQKGGDLKEVFGRLVKVNNIALSD